MSSFLRQIAAFPFSWHPEYGLDFCYLTTQILVTSGPSSTYPQRAYQNPDDKLVKFLDNKHGENWAIWEFRAEGTGYHDDRVHGRVNHFPWPDHQPPPFSLVLMVMTSMRDWLSEKERSCDQDKEKGGRVAVLHCWGGKGRSGTMACSYMISECGWALDQALARFTQRRMRSGFGEGVSVPSQLRWVGYVDRWTKYKKLYVERQIEIEEVHVWGIRDGVEVSIKGYVNAGKEVQIFHTFTNEERINTASLGNFETGHEARTKRESRANHNGGMAIFKPATRVILPTSDVNVSFKRYIQAVSNYKIPLSMARIWFNGFFEGNGPENNGQADVEGVFEIDWDEMDGIKGFLYKGTRALDRIAIVWKVYDPASTTEVIHERA